MCKFARLTQLKLLNVLRKQHSTAPRRRAASPKDHTHLVHTPIISKRHAYWTARQCLIVERSGSDAAADALGILDRDLVARGAILENDLEPRPRPGYAGVQNQKLSL